MQVSLRHALQHLCRCEVVLVLGHNFDSHAIGHPLLLHVPSLPDFALVADVAGKAIL